MNHIVLSPLDSVFLKAISAFDHKLHIYTLKSQPAEIQTDSYQRSSNEICSREDLHRPISMKPRILHLLPNVHEKNLQLLHRPP
jgi:hypothetical protein